MGAIEVPAMIAALVMLFGAVGAKVITTQLIDRTNGQISRVAQTKKDALSRLRGTQNQKAVAEQNMRMLEAKRKKLSRKLTRLRREEKNFVEEENSRKQRTAMRKVE